MWALWGLSALAVAALLIAVLVEDGASLTGLAGQASAAGSQRATVRIDGAPLASTPGMALAPASQGDLGTLPAGCEVQVQRTASRAARVLVVGGTCQERGGSAMGLTGWVASGALDPRP